MSDECCWSMYDIQRSTMIVPSSNVVVSHSQPKTKEVVSSVCHRLLGMHTSTTLYVPMDISYASVVDVVQYYVCTVVEICTGVLYFYVCNSTCQSYYGRFIVIGSKFHPRSNGDADWLDSGLTQSRGRKS